MKFALENFWLLGMMGTFRGFLIDLKGLRERGAPARGFCLRLMVRRPI